MKTLKQHLFEALRVKAGTKLSSKKIIVKTKKEFQDIVKAKILSAKNGVLNLSHIRFENFISLSEIFENVNLYKIKKINVFEWEMPNATSLQNTFANLDQIEEIDGLGTWNVENIINFHRMFYNCKNLKHVDGIENWNINLSKIRLITYMFYNCSKLNIDISSWGFYDSNGVLTTELSLYNLYKNSGVKIKAD
jgi:surface protein